MGKGEGVSGFPETISSFVKGRNLEIVPVHSKIEEKPICVLLKS